MALLRKINGLSDLTKEEQILVIDELRKVPTIKVDIPKEKRSVVLSIDELSLFLMTREVFDFEKLKMLNKILVEFLPEEIHSLALRLGNMFKDVILKSEIEKKLIKRMAWESFKIDKQELDLELDIFRMNCKQEYEDAIKIEKNMEVKK